MLRAAIYARKSTDHQEDSTTVQVGSARAYVASQGWIVADQHVFVDDSISRAEYKKRPQLYALLNAAERRDFDVIVMRDVDRLGGDTNRNGVILSDLIDRGVRVDEYLTKNTVRLDNAIAKFMAAAKNFGAELEREKTSQRTFEALRVKAARRLNVGGRCFGYDNVREHDGVHYRVNEEQAGVVRDIFRMFVGGYGLKRIARELNKRGIRPPLAGKRGTGSWSPSSIRPVLQRERYRGVMKWGEFEKMFRLATKVRVRRSLDDEDRVRVEAVELRIVDDHLWFAAQARFADEAHRSPSRRGGRPPRHLLTGIARCSRCGGPISATQGRHGKTAIRVYMCGYHKTRGPEVCSSSLRRPTASVHTKVVGWLLDALSPSLSFKLVADLHRSRAAEAAKLAKQSPCHEKEASTLRREIERLVSALAQSDDRPGAIVEAITSRQARLKEVEAQATIARLAPDAAVAELDKLQAAAEEAIGMFRALLDKNPEEARQVVTTFFDRIDFTPVQTPAGPRFKIEGDAKLGRLVGIEGVPEGVAVLTLRPQGDSNPR